MRRLRDLLAKLKGSVSVREREIEGREPRSTASAKDVTGRLSSERDKADTASSSDSGRFDRYLLTAHACMNAWCPPGVDLLEESQEGLGHAGSEVLPQER